MAAIASASRQVCSIEGSQRTTAARNRHPEVGMCVASDGSIQRPWTVLCDGLVRWLATPCFAAARSAFAALCLLAAVLIFVTVALCDDLQALAVPSGVLDKALRLSPRTEPTVMRCNIPSSSKHSREFPQAHRAQAERGGKHSAARRAVRGVHQAGVEAAGCKTQSREHRCGEDPWACTAAWFTATGIPDAASYCSTVGQALGGPPRHVQLRGGAGHPVRPGLQD
mmetsp:Transcript_144540/g.402760  ORF Transcript_144540/g.402760 Transcript_144540/m.402760 type:complete len:225 (+) Transcript_144540:264-938(+)